MQRLTYAKSIKWLYGWQMNGLAQMTHYGWLLTAVNSSILLRASIRNLPYNTEQMSLAEWHRAASRQQRTWLFIDRYS